MKTLIIPPADTPLSFVVLLAGTNAGIAGVSHDRKNTAAEALSLARDIAAAGTHVRVMQEIAFTVDANSPAPHSQAIRPDVRDALIRRLVNVLNKAGMEVLEERMPSLIEIAEAMTEAKAHGFVPTGSKAEPIKYPDTEAGKSLRAEHEREREALRKQHEEERRLYL